MIKNLRNQVSSIKPSKVSIEKEKLFNETIEKMRNFQPNMTKSAFNNYQPDEENQHLINNFHPEKTETLLLIDDNNIDASESGEVE